MAPFDGQLGAGADTMASAPSADALYELGLRYSLGREVATDLVAAHKWFNLSAIRGNTEARRIRAEIAAEMSRDEVAAAQREAREWLRRH
jgi:TPR repeat protein